MGRRGLLGDIDSQQPDMFYNNTDWGAHANPVVSLVAVNRGINLEK
jgi:hypothetical protein